jgi:hypothetical protein|tara:strand:- start:2312 stop:2608 length:297 start_codon:yes stop_codon:yes gene_type:complete
MSQYKELQKNVSRVILSIGDIVVDNIGGHIGILTRRTRHIDMIEDDVFVWEVKWLNNVAKEFYEVSPMSTRLEEEGLKLSIVIGTYEWHSIDGGTFEL